MNDYMSFNKGNLFRRFRPIFLLMITLFFALFSNFASGYTCRNKQTGSEMMGGDSSVTVPLPRTITAGEEIFVDLDSYYECRNTAPDNFVDFMYLQSDGVSTVLSRDFEVGAYLNGVRNLIPIPYSLILHLPRGGDSNWHNLPVKVFYKVSDTPGVLARISRGQQIATIRLYKYAHYQDRTVPDDPRYFTWSIIAGNDSIFTSGTCAINNGKNIDIDFGQIPASRLRASAAESTYQREVTIPYRCKNPITMPIKITLSADTSGFSNTSIMTSNQDLGVEMYYENQKIKPGTSIHTQLLSGLGSTDLNFVLIKKPGADVTAGPFSGSAVLIMSAD